MQCISHFLVAWIHDNRFILNTHFSIIILYVLIFITWYGEFFKLMQEDIATKKISFTFIPYLDVFFFLLNAFTKRTTWIFFWKIVSLLLWWTIHGGSHLVKLLHCMIVRKILKHIPNFTKYWKIDPKIVLFNRPPNIPFQLRKPIVSPNIVGIHLYRPIFNTLFISYYQVLTNKRPNTC